MYLRLQLVDGVQGMLLRSTIMHDLVFYRRKLKFHLECTAMYVQTRSTQVF